MSKWVLLSKLELISISFWLFCTTGIISVGRMHPYLAFLFHRDYFHRSDASLSRSFVPQRLFPPAECISIFLFFTTRIISTARIHPCLAFLFHRDYFHRPDASLSCSFSSQGLFRPDQIRPPSLKTSLPGHSVNFRFISLNFTISYPNSKYRILVGFFLFS